MTPQEFYDGPAMKLLELAAAKRAFLSLVTDGEIDAIWERICRRCRRPSVKGNVFEDLASIIAWAVSLGETASLDVLSKANEVMKPKMVDYAGDEDFAANFKRSAQRAGLTPAKVWAVFASKHWDAVTAYIRNGKTESEPILDRLADIVNYCELLAGMVAEGTA